MKPNIVWLELKGKKIMKKLKANLNPIPAPQNIPLVSKQNNKTIPFEARILLAVNKALLSPTIEETIEQKVKEAVEGEALEGLIKKTFLDVIASKEFIKTVKEKVSAEIKNQIDDKIKDVVDCVRIET